MSKKKAFESLVNEVLSTVQSAKTFVGKQAPDIVKELVIDSSIKIKYEVISDTLVTACCLSASLFLGHLAMTFPEDRYGVSVGTVLSVIGCALTSIVTLVGLCSAFGNFVELKRMKAAPKVFIIRKLKNLLAEKEE